MRPPFMGSGNEVHLTTANNGHILTTDCWCEPSRIYWYKNQHGVVMLVVEHEDYTLKHRIVVLSERERDRDLTCNDYHSDHDWITRALTPPWTWSPPLLPPHQPEGE